MKKLLLFLIILFLCPSVSLAAYSGSGENYVILNGATQTDRPITVSRVFAIGDIANYAKAFVDGGADEGLSTQCNVLSRWNDGSVKHAMISFVVPSITSGGSTTVYFANQSSSASGSIFSDVNSVTSAELATYDFEAQITLTYSSTDYTASAEAMIEAGAYEALWSGPIATAIMVRDHAGTHDIDLSTGENLRPMFEVRFYAQGSKAEVTHIVENTLCSSTQADSFSDSPAMGVRFLTGDASPTSEIYQASATMLGATKIVRGPYWLGTDLGAVHVNHNVAYMKSSGAIPNYDPALDSSSLISTLTSDWAARESGGMNDMDGNTASTGSGHGVGFYITDLDATGDAAFYHIGLLPAWDAIYLNNMGHASAQDAFDIIIANCQRGYGIPYFYREADSLAGSGDYFTGGSGETLGRIVSLDARPTVNLSSTAGVNATNITSATQIAADRIYPGTFTDAGYDGLDTSHMPNISYATYLLTGYQWALDGLQQQAAYALGWPCGNTTDAWCRHGADSFIIGQLRGVGWSTWIVGSAAFISPDTAPEKTYFEDKLWRNISYQEGRQELTITNTDYQSQYDIGVTAGGSGYPNAIHGWMYDSYAATTLSGTRYEYSPWMYYFTMSAYGMLRQFGYDTDEMLTFLAGNLFPILLSPDVGSKYTATTYRHPAIMDNDGLWVGSWSEFAGCWGTLPSAWGGYANQMRAALSFLSHYDSGAYTGSQALAAVSDAPSWGDYVKYAIVAQDLIGVQNPAAQATHRLRANGMTISGGTLR